MNLYAKGELIAEMAASFLCAHAGIIEAEIENSAAYLQGWIKALKGRDAKTWIVKAASEAQKAADYILNVPNEIAPREKCDQICDHATTNATERVVREFEQFSQFMIDSKYLRLG